MFSIYVAAQNYRDTMTDRRFRVEAHRKLITEKQRRSLETSQSFPAWTHSYVYTFNKNVKIYACLQREARIALYYADGDLKCESISDNNQATTKFTSRKELIFLLPKQIRRKILIQTILE
jgi:hypothetical protein